MTIRFATENDFEILKKYDTHIKVEELQICIKLNRVIVLFEENNFVGWLRFNMFWDSIPFMNMLYMLEPYRAKGYGAKLIDFWETEMKKDGHDIVMTSTLSNEQGQFFYRKHDYKDIGGFVLPEESLEIMFYKKL